MGKTFRRDSNFRPKAHGRIFNKDQQPWKKNKKKDVPKPNEVPLDSKPISEKFES